MVNILEVDKAQIFQKIGETEKRVRNELTTKHLAEKSELQETL